MKNLPILIVQLFSSWCYFKHFRKAGGVLACFLMLGMHSSAQLDSSREAILKAAFILNFTQFVEWAPEAFPSSESPFVIGILGDDPLGSSMDETVEGEKVKGHPLMVQRYQDAKEVKNCHILYITSKDAGKVEDILVNLPGRNLLTVGEPYNFPRVGGIIRFFTIENKIKLQINPGAAKAANLVISSKLLRLAEIID